MDPEQVPAARYTRSGDLDIAYGVAGEGDLDVVFVPGFVSHVEMGWEPIGFGPMRQRLASFARLIYFDKRGTGMSDRTAGIATLEERMDDVRAVMDAAGSERAAIVGISEGGPMSVLFAATYPERVSALVLWGSCACFRDAPDYPHRIPAGMATAFTNLLEDRWGSGEPLSVFVRRHPGDEAWLPEAAARFERNWATPRAVRVLMEMNFQIDVRHALPAISTPTLVLHRTDDPIVPVAHGRFLAEHIPGARYVELGGDYHVGCLAGDDDDALDEIERFLTGELHAEVDDADRVLKTVLFTDIVDSTRRAVELGDRRWRALLDQHDTVTGSEVERFRGRVVKTTGDGALAVFDGPARAVRAALALHDRTRAIGLPIRAGLHAGECEIRGDDIGGIAVHIGARVLAMAGAGEVLVSSTVRDLVAGSGLTFTERGRHELKGVPGSWEILAVAS